MDERRVLSRAHAADLAELIEHTGFGPALICGISVGGLIAQAVYLKKPDLVRKIVLSNTAHKIGTAEVWNGRIAAVEAEARGREGLVATEADVDDKIAEAAQQRGANPGQLVNGALTARVGIAAMEVCRPLPFIHQPRPRVANRASRCPLATCMRRAVRRAGGCSWSMP